MAKRSVLDTESVYTDRGVESVKQFGGPSLMPKAARRVGTVLGSFVLAWLAAAVLARWLFGSGNILVWVVATVAGIGAYFALLWREQRAG
jgi:hypothetical protein